MVATATGRGRNALGTKTEVRAEMIEGVLPPRSAEVLDELSGKEKLGLDHQGDRLVLDDTVKMKMIETVVAASQRHSRSFQKKNVMCHGAISTLP